MEITKTELQLMDVIWQIAPCDANQVIDVLNESDTWHEKTVKTLLGRLVKKGALGFEKQGRSYIYTQLIEQDAFQVKESESFVKRLFKGRLSPLVATFAKTNKLTERDVDELKKIISDWEQNKDNK